MDKLTVLGIAGSPRRKGNSETLLDWTLESAAARGAAVEKIRACDLKFSPCRECGSCNKTGVCVQDDEMQLIYPKFLAADRVIIATPMFFMNMPAQMKAFVDRFQCLWAKKYLLKQPLRDDNRVRRGYAVAVGGTKGQSLFNGLNQLFKCFYPILDIEFEEADSLYFRSVDEKGAIASHPAAKAGAAALGEKIALGD
ncbi:MAG: flavodoxin family protein [bacterium]